MSQIYVGNEPEHRYVMISIDKDSQQKSYPYFAVGGDVYEKLKNELVLGVVKVRKDGTIVDIENTPKLNQYSMYSPPQELTSEQKIWRYLEYYKFDDLINSSTLYLSRLDQFIDNLEGVSPDSCRKAILVDERLSDEQKKANLEKFEQRMKRNRTSGFVCCWHVNETINTEMWDSYGNESTESIAIETSVERLRHSTKYSQLPVLFEKIRYYENPFFNQEAYWFPTLFKQKDFEHECEYRSGVFISGLDSNKFVRIKVDLKRLISRIYIHPEASANHIRKVKALIKHNNLDDQLIKFER